MLHLLLDYIFSVSNVTINKGEIICQIYRREEIIKHLGSQKEEWKSVYDWKGLKLHLCFGLDVVMSFIWQRDEWNIRGGMSDYVERVRESVWECVSVWEWVSVRVSVRVRVCECECESECEWACVSASVREWVWVWEWACECESVWVQVRMWVWASECECERVSVRVRERVRACECACEWVRVWVHVWVHVWVWASECESYIFRLHTSTEEASCLDVFCLPLNVASLIGSPNIVSPFTPAVSSLGIRDGGSHEV